MKSHEVEDIKREIPKAELLFNRTGIMTSPDLSAELIRGAKKTSQVRPVIISKQHQAGRTM
jgi:hypothetical protein